MRLLKPLYKLNTLAISEPVSKKSRVLSARCPRVLRVPDLMVIFARFSHHPFMVNGYFSPRVSNTKVAIGCPSVMDPNIALDLKGIISNSCDSFSGKLSLKWAI